ncbi:MAG: Rv3654c family TadE-like protein [Leucobacter sp.]
MSAPVVTACSIVALALGLPVLAAGMHLEARHRIAGAADAAALAAADAAAGWVNGTPCEIAGGVAAAANAHLAQCDVDEATATARVSVREWTPLGPVEIRARAGPPQRQ